MTYQELLDTTAARKKQARAELNSALSGAGGFLVRAELERKPGTVAWLWLAKDFCETLAEHLSEIMEEFKDDPWSFEAREITDIYCAYEDGDPDLYDLLPWEAQLFED